MRRPSSGMKRVVVRVVDDTIHPALTTHIHDHDPSVGQIPVQELIQRLAGGCGL